MARMTRDTFARRRKWDSKDVNQLYVNSCQMPFHYQYLIFGVGETLVISVSHSSFQDAKVMSWWDYGYQITAMANRTILVDNNTWNNTHISRVGQVR